MAQVLNGKPDQSYLDAIARLTAENEALKAAAAAKANGVLSIKVGKAGKGNVSVYGLGRFPVTLYAPQWLKVLGIADDIRAFIVAHDGEMSQGKPAGKLVRLDDERR